MSAAQTQAARDLLEATEDLMAWCVKNIDVFHFGEYDRAHKAAERLRKALPPVEVWRDGEPPKHGVYKVKRVGKASVARGYSFWNGERWGMIFTKHSTANKCRLEPTRKTPSRYPMQRLQKGGAA
jgi:hypothetical protein